MIGDSLEADIEGAQKIGMDTIHFDNKDLHNHHSFKRITNLKAIENHL
jgi:putative hydrolase of the HAD superfamily